MTTTRTRRNIKRQKTNTPEIINDTNSIDLSSDLTYLISYINTDDIFLWMLLSNQITNTSLSDLYQRSNEVGWQQVFIEIRNDLKLDEKPKLKRFILNRLIHECSTNAEIFNEKVKKLNEEMKRQMSDTIPPEQDCRMRLQTIKDVYSEVKAWQKLQRERRLVYKNYSQRHSLLTLQRLITDQFIHLVNLLRGNPNFLQLGGKDAFIELFHHSLIIVVQPSGTDCVAVTKYEKVGNDFVAKIKTRIICLLDPDRIEQYVKLSNIDVILYPKDRKHDPKGDVQSPLEWKKRRVMCNETEQRTFWYTKLNENDSIKLTKKAANRKLLYNNGLCQLEFRTVFKLIGTDFEESVTLNSQSFGLCSHAKYSPKYVTKVFIEEVAQMSPETKLDTHMSTLEGYINQFHKRISGVEVKPHTREFIHNELLKIYTSFQKSASSPTEPVMFFSLDIYKNILEKFFTQIKFLGSHPFLSMMYHDSLFLGICSNTVDDKLKNGTQTKPHLIMRFALSEEQEKPENANIIFTMYNGKLSTVRVIHSYFIANACECICEAAENEKNSLQVFDGDKILPFDNFSWYHDNDLSRDILKQTENEITYLSLRALFRNEIQKNPIQPQTVNEQQLETHTFYLLGELTGNTNLNAEAMSFLQEQFTHWCSIRNVKGSLSQYPIDNEDVDGDAFNDLFNENN